MYTEDELSAVMRSSALGKGFEQHGANRAAGPQGLRGHRATGPWPSAETTKGESPISAWNSEATNMHLSNERFT